VVYVSPTKALVNQIALEASARFEKVLNRSFQAASNIFFLRIWPVVEFWLGISQKNTITSHETVR